MHNILLTKTQVELDFNVNSTIKHDLSKQKIMGEDPDKKERVLGRMIERQFDIEKLCRKKNISHSDLLTIIKNHEPNK